jgi:hypothetical protein
MVGVLPHGVPDDRRPRHGRGSGADGAQHLLRRLAEAAGSGKPADAYVRKAMLNTFLSWRRRTSWGREHGHGVLPDRPGVDSSARIDEQHRLR